MLRRSWQAAEYPALYARLEAVLEERNNVVRLRAAAMGHKVWMEWLGWVIWRWINGWGRDTETRRTSEVVGELFLSICVAGGRKGAGEVVEVEGFHESGAKQTTETATETETDSTAPT